MIKFANTSSLFILSKPNDNYILAKCTVRVSTSFMSLLLAVSTRYGHYCIQKNNNDGFHP